VTYQTVEEIIAERDALRAELARLMEKHNALHVNAKALRTELQAAHKMSLNGVEWREEAEKLRAELDALKQDVEKQEPVAWRTFDGEGGYDYRSFSDNEDYRDEFIERNPNHATWVEPLYASPVPAQSVPDGFREGAEAAARLIDQKAELYATRFGHDNTGGISFGQGPHAKSRMDHYTGLLELADELRAALAKAPKPEAKP